MIRLEFVNETLLRRKAKRIAKLGSHSLKHKKYLKNFSLHFFGKTEGKIKRKRRRHKQLVDDLKEKRGY
jgi:hypothetical protein